MRKSAFTLIELLVVIAIIAILAAILFPVFAQAKLAAKKTQSLSNVKNLGTATHIYLADNDDYFPLGNVYNVVNNRTSYNRFIASPVEQVAAWSASAAAVEGMNASRAFYMNSLQPYIKSDGIWDDPSATSTTSIYTLSFYGGLPYQNTKNNFAFAFNGLLTQYAQSSVGSSSDLILFSMDGNRKAPGAWFTNPTIGCTQVPGGVCVYSKGSANCATATGTNGDNSFFSRSSGGAGFNMYGNGSWPVVYADSHAKTRKIGVFSNGLTDPRRDFMANWAGTDMKVAVAANTRWWSAEAAGGCHAYMFRPDLDFQTWDAAVAL